MTKKAFWLGVCLSAAIALWGTAGQVFAGPKAGQTNHGKAHMQQTAHTNGQAHGNGQGHGTSNSSGTVTTTGGASAHTSSGTSPVGNNGTVKIDNYNDKNGNDVAQNNEPHVSCVWGVDAYGYEFSAPVGMEAFSQHSPTPGFGGNAAAQRMALANQNPRGNGATYNGSTTNAFAAVGSPHPKQGYHVRLTYTAPDGNSHGSTVKHKMFWVQPCAGTTGGGGSNGGGTHGGVGGGGVSSGSTTASVLAMRTASGSAAAARPGQAVTGTPGFTG